MRVRATKCLAAKQSVTNCLTALKKIGIDEKGGINQLLDALGVQVFSIEGIEESKIKPVQSLVVLPNGTILFHRIYIASNIINHPNPSKRATLVNICVSHELAHVLQKDPPAYYKFQEEGKATPESALHKALVSYMRDPESRLSVESRAELYAAALMFRNSELFEKMFFETQADFRRISHEFIAPIDCTVKWSLLRNAAFPMHYFKYNVDTQIVEDLFVPPHPLYADFPTLSQDIIKHDLATVAYKSLKTKSDQHGITKARNGIKYFCRAYHLEEDTHLGTPEKIVISGMPLEIHELLKRLQIKR